ncbi:hypothetical protein C0J52_04997 [Blattella germanica]|nr:hypothetical protein C0J52_04997 [Blattella germanica]
MCNENECYIQYKFNCICKLKITIVKYWFQNSSCISFSYYYNQPASSSCYTRTYRTYDHI